ncbi:unnamed protein product [Bursaphelenchus okinawaensis]|uniref:tRNA-intron lyase n=1 Tax=Bursaphelenchus okinawaensis TaxID=465554 RepID=A0A811JS96_9BILA|nr:unnamed protein product [Bursaphelenchus okinawaensis]CAG9080711.1 unnamed protein product [Bursaphelenchus okinawaensis]
MSRNIICDVKRGYNVGQSVEIDANVFPIEAVFRGGDVVVDNHNVVLHKLGYGTKIGQRMNFYNKRCFPTVDIGFVDNDEPSTLIENFSLVPLEEEEEAVGGIRLMNNNMGYEWIEKTANEKLFLSPEEALYLLVENKIVVKGWSLEKLWSHWRSLKLAKRFFAYKHFRDLGWIVKSGLVFGGDFSLYKYHPEQCHSSVVVRLDVKPGSLEVVSLKRELKNVKKALFVVCVDIENDLSDLEPCSSVKITVNQEVSLMRGSELAELNSSLVTT